MVTRKAEAFRYLMENKSTIIFDDELIVGNVGEYRKSAIIQPELSGVFSSQELLWMERRKTTPFRISWKDRFRLLTGVIPYWLPRNMIVRAFWPNVRHLLSYTFDQLNPNYYLINEAAGIGHFIPNYEKVIRFGLQAEINALQGKDDPLSRAMISAASGVLAYAKRMAEKAREMAQKENNRTRADELNEIAGICDKVPAQPAESFHEALQSIWFCHMAVCLEGINSAVSFGRLDQMLNPFFSKDIESGRITPEKAKELLLAFSAKTNEHVFLISEKMSKYHGGFLTAQAAIVGGVDDSGENAVNELSWLFLDVMEELGLRDPNYQVRINGKTPDSFTNRALEVAREGNGSPAFFSDTAVISSLMAHGYPEEEARNYGVVGCVEPTIPGKSFCSTDAALVNLPVCLELALNRGKRFGSGKRVGLATPDPFSFGNIEEVIDAYRIQLEFLIKRFVRDIRTLEAGNRDYHPTPFSSLLVDGCQESARDLTEGGALYKTSGVQGVGVADVVDSLMALDEVVFQKKIYSIERVIKALKKNFRGEEELRTRLLNSPKFGNDHSETDRLAERVMSFFHGFLVRNRNVRGGTYIPGFYSSTCHVGFGEQTAALPSGRKAGQPFAASMSSANGMDRSGPTAVLNSVASTNPDLSPNGYAVNLSFDPHTIKGEKGLMILSSLLGGFFEKRGMEMQLNVHDHTLLEDALQHPGKYPGIVVRVAGYCAFFDDLPHEVKEEVIARNRQSIA